MYSALLNRTLVAKIRERDGSSKADDADSLGRGRRRSSNTLSSYVELTDAEFFDK